MMLSLPKSIAALIAVVVFCFGGVVGRSSAALTPSQVLLLYNSQNAESLAIRNAYIAKHPTVNQLDLNINYASYPPGSGPHDPPDTATAITSKYITPEAFITLVRNPLWTYLQAHPGILSIATTRGLPAGVGIDFTPAGGYLPVEPDSFESELARIGHITTAASMDVPEDNQYYGRLNTPYSSFIGDDCQNVAPDYGGKIFLVTRLDSSKQNGNGTYVDAVVALINRSATLQVNKFAVTLVLDDKSGCGILETERAAIPGDMCDAGWCVYFDQTLKFLHGKNQPSTAPFSPGCVCTCCGCWESGVEGAYTAYPELVHAGLGYNHTQIGVCSGTSLESVCSDYIRHYQPHSAGLFVSTESYNGWSIHADQYPGGSLGTYQGNALDWIAAGGSFTFGHVAEPMTPRFHADYCVPNLYVHGLSWGEAAYTSITKFGSKTTPIGDPLATVSVINPDVDGDLDVDATDLAIVTGPPGIDLDGDGTAGGASDIAFVNQALGRSCAGQTCWPDSLETPDYYCVPGGIIGAVDPNTGTLDQHGVSPWLCRGDINNDWHINTTDVNLVIDMQGCDCPEGDVDGDGDVDSIDLMIVYSYQFQFLLFADVNEDSALNCLDYQLLRSCDPQYDRNCDGEITHLDFYPIWILTGGVDADGNGVVNCADAALVAACCQSGTGCQASYDVDYDGVVSFWDVFAIIMHIKYVSGEQAAQGAQCITAITTTCPSSGDGPCATITCP